MRHWSANWEFFVLRWDFLPGDLFSEIPKFCWESPQSQDHIRSLLGAPVSYLKMCAGWCRHGRWGHGEDIQPRCSCSSPSWERQGTWGLSVALLKTFTWSFCFQSGVLCLLSAVLHDPILWGSAFQKNYPLVFFLYRKGPFSWLWSGGGNLAPCLKDSKNSCSYGFDPTT